MNYPIPTHLQPFLNVVGDDNSEYEVTGVIHCPCGCDEFEVFESNDRQIVKLKCKKCGKEIEVLDTGKHGWNGFVCKDDFTDRSLPFNQFVCDECGKDSFKVTVSISSQGKEDFIEECVANDDSFSEDDWVDGFEWIRISLECVNCSCADEEWVDMELM